MGDRCDQHRVDRNQKKEITGASGNKNQNFAGLKIKKNQAKKIVFFLKGEVFFFLTRPLMGDPFTFFDGHKIVIIGSPFQYYLH